jgi:hypothetical protein
MFDEKGFRALCVFVLIAGLVAMAASVDMAEHAYTWGGYMQRGLVMAGMGIGAVLAFVAFVALVFGERA